MDKRQEEMWREFINDLDVKPLEDSEIEPEEEGRLLKYSFDIYFIMPTNGQKCYSLQTDQHLSDMGTMSMQNALDILKKKARSKK